MPTTRRQYRQYRSVLAAAIICVVGTLAAAVTAQAGEYWPSEDKGSFVFDNGSSGLKRCEVAGTAAAFTYSFQSYPFSALSHLASFSFAPSGDLLLTRFRDSMNGLEVTSYVFDRPVLFLRGGMQPGDSWTHAGVADITDAGPIAFNAVVTVLGRETVRVGAGTFETLKVSVTGLVPYYLCGVYNLHYQLGPVKINNWELSSWRGVVPAAPTGWGEVKALFR